MATHTCDAEEQSVQLRPHVVFFGESVPNYEVALAEARRADLLMVVGTSLNVYPAAGLVKAARARDIYVVDPNPPTVRRRHGCTVRYVRHAATSGVPQAVDEILRNFGRLDAAGKSAPGVE